MTTKIKVKAYIPKSEHLNNL